MSYEPDDFDWPSKVCLAWIHYFQETGAVEVDDLKQALADIANSFDEAVERTQEEDPGSSHTITWDNIVSASTYG